MVYDAAFDHLLLAEFNPGALRMHINRRSFIVATLGGLSTACAAAGGQRQGSLTPSTQLSVENQAFLDVVIYVVIGSQRVRLGQVSGNSTTVLDIPSQYIFGPTPMQFVADPVGSSRAPISETITVSPGDVVTLRIPPS